MKKIAQPLLIILLFFAGQIAIAQSEDEPIQCKTVVNKVEGTFANSSQTSPIITQTRGGKPSVGDKGEILVNFQSSVFGGLFSGSLVIATAEVKSVNGSKVTFTVLEKHSTIEINGKKRNYFTKGRDAFFNQYEYEVPHEVSKTWPGSTKLKETGYEVCGKKLGVWAYFTEEGVLEKSYSINDRDKIDGEYKEYYPSQKVSFECTYDNGDREGPYKAYYESGKLKEEGKYDWRGEKEGTVIGYYENGKQMSVYDSDSRELKEYHENGTVKTEGKYNYRKEKDGTWEEFYANGSKKSYIVYDDNAFEGAYKLWFENGNPMEEGRYNYNGDKDGTWKTYWENGKEKWIRSYYRGEKKGEVLKYYANGQLKSSSNFSSGKLNGIYKKFYESGKPKASGEYKDGEKDGSWEQFFEEGGLMVSTVFKEGKISGKVVSYSAPGVIKYKATRMGRKFVGPFEEYYDSGKLKEIGTYSQSGTKEELWVTYFENGKIESKGKYANGVKTGKWIEHVDGKKKKVKY